MPRCSVTHYTHLFFTFWNPKTPWVQYFTTVTTAKQSRFIKFSGYNRRILRRRIISSRPSIATYAPCGTSQGAAHRLDARDVFVLFLPRYVVPTDVPARDTHLQVLVLLGMRLRIAQLLHAEHGELDHAAAVAVEPMPSAMVVTRLMLGAR